MGKMSALVVYLGLALFVWRSACLPAFGQSERSAHDVGCRLAYVQRLVLRLSQDSITTGMRSFVASDAHKTIKDDAVRQLLTNAFSATRRALTLMDSGTVTDARGVGIAISEGNMALIGACGLSRWEECRSFDAELRKTGRAPADEALAAVTKLSDRGGALWAADATVPARQGDKKAAAPESLLSEGSKWNLCGPGCQKTFPVSVAKRNGETITLNMPFGTLDVPQALIEVVNSEKRIIRIKQSAEKQ